jgi:MmyB-like transcription regulator ligand binding domain
MWRSPEAGVRLLSRWGAHDVRLHRTGLKHIRDPVVGDLHLSYEVMELTAEAGSPADDALRFLASWAATHEPADALAGERTGNLVRTELPRKDSNL